jgi:ACS family sodium-dependent inorganic phosphate cotransporter
MDVGNVVGLLVAPPLIATFGWPSVFYLFGLGGFLWVAAWPRVLPDGGLSVGAAALASSSTTVPQTPPPRSLAAAPDDQRAAAAAPEQDRAGQADGSWADDVPWADIVRSREVWAVTFTHFSYNWGYYTLLAWLPSYFDGALGQVRATHSSWHQCAVAATRRLSLDRLMKRTVSGSALRDTSSQGGRFSRTMVYI